MANVEKRAQSVEENKNEIEKTEMERNRDEKEITGKMLFGSFAIDKDTARRFKETQKRLANDFFNISLSFCFHKKRQSNFQRKREELAKWEKGIMTSNRFVQK